MSAEDLSDLPMLDLFRLEAETQVQALIENLLVLERVPMAAEPLEACMRAAHSLKGAARIVGLNAGVGVAHAMEDCFVAPSGVKSRSDKSKSTCSSKALIY
jgi:two-component system sensor histidine kinase and response regulator WspE